MTKNVSDLFYVMKTVIYTDDRFKNLHLHLTSKFFVDHIDVVHDSLTSVSTLKEQLQVATSSYAPMDEVLLILGCILQRFIFIGQLDRTDVEEMIVHLTHSGVMFSESEVLGDKFPKRVAANTKVSNLLEHPWAFTISLMSMLSYI